MTRTRSLRELFGTAMIIVGAWIVVALFSSSEGYRVSIDTGFKPSLSWSLMAYMTYYQLIVGLLWATFTPPIIFIAERLPLIKPFRWRNIVAVLAVTPVVALFRAALGGVVLALHENTLSLDPFLDLVAFSVEVRFHRNIFVTLVVFGVYNLILAYRAAAASERQVLAAKKQLANEELQRLRGAIQPRFFNGALAAVNAQVHASPMVADRMIVQFSAVLRKMLELEKRTEVSLAEELDVVERCLSLETTRTDGRFTASVTADESLLAARVPPLVLHTIVASVVLGDGVDDGELEIAASRSGGMLRIVIRSGDPRRLPESAALEAARARLRRLFADGASLEASSSAGTEKVLLTMPLVLRDQPVRTRRDQLVT